MPSLKTDKWTDNNWPDVDDDARFSRETRRKSFPLDIGFHGYSDHRADGSSNDLRRRFCIFRAHRQHHHHQRRSFNGPLCPSEGRRRDNVTRKSHAATFSSSSLVTATTVKSSSFAERRTTDNEKRPEVRHRSVRSHRSKIRHRTFVNDKRVGANVAGVAKTDRRDETNEKTARTTRRRRPKGAKTTNELRIFNDEDVGVTWFGDYVASCGCCCCCCCSETLKEETRVPAVAGNGRTGRGRRDATESSPSSSSTPLPTPTPTPTPPSAAAAAARTADGAARPSRRRRRERWFARVNVDSRNSRRRRVVRGCRTGYTRSVVVRSRSRRECRFVVVSKTRKTKSAHASGYYEEGGRENRRGSSRIDTCEWISVEKLSGIRKGFVDADRGEGINGFGPGKEASVDDDDDDRRGIGINRSGRTTLDVRGSTRSGIVGESVGIGTKSKFEDSEEADNPDETDVGYVDDDSFFVIQTIGDLREADDPDKTIDGCNTDVVFFGIETLEERREADHPDETIDGYSTDDTSFGIETFAQLLLVDHPDKTIHGYSTDDTFFDVIRTQGLAEADDFYKTNYRNNRRDTFFQTNIPDDSREAEISQKIARDNKNVNSHLKIETSTNLREPDNPHKTNRGNNHADIFLKIETEDLQKSVDPLETDGDYNDEDDTLLNDIVAQIEILLGDDDGQWANRPSFDTEARSEFLKNRRKDMTTDVVDSGEDNERYDEFDSVMVPVARSLSKSPQSDEGIETDTEARKAGVTRCWSLDSANAGDDEGSRSRSSQRDAGSNKQKVTRCWSSDSAVLSDEEQVKGWENLILCDGAECESTEGRPRYWRTPSVVVSDYSDYSYLDEKYERSDPDLEKYEAGMSETPSQASSCSCLDSDEIGEFDDLANTLDRRLLQVCGRRRHSDSCCACLTSNGAIANGNVPSNRRNSCLASPNPYRRNSNGNKIETGNYTNNESRTTSENKPTIELLKIPPSRKISNCSTNSSLSGDDFEVTELQPLKRPQSSGWRKLRNIVQWTPFFQTYKKQRYPWVQLAGHQGNFRAGPTPGTILKKLCPQEEACFKLLMRDVLRPYVPEFKGVLDVRESDDSNPETETTMVKQSEENSNKGAIVASYLQLQDLLGDFEQPCVMDCKIGVRTYLESELAKAKERPKLRKDMYEKMIQVDPSAPNTEERRVQGVTKPRYMVWRETISSTATLGFRVEGMKLGRGNSSKDFKTTRTREQVTEALKRFVENYPHAIPKYLQRLKAIRATLKASPFFASHEIVGSSLLFVHDAKNAGVWMIDFAKTLPLPGHLSGINHDAVWQVGNHEDGYLIGVNNLIDIFQDIKNSET